MESRSATSMGCSVPQVLPVPAAQKAELALMMLEGPFGCPSAITDLCPSLQSGLAEGPLFTAGTICLTVNDKPKSLCTAIQPLLHLQGTQECCMTASGRQMSSTLCAQSPCWQHQPSSDNKPQWQQKENSSSRGNRNKVMPLSNHI